MFSTSFRAKSAYWKLSFFVSCLKYMKDSTRGFYVLPLLFLSIVVIVAQHTTTLTFVQETKKSYHPFSIGDRKAMAYLLVKNLRHISGTQMSKLF